MKIIFEKRATDDFLSFDRQLQEFFRKHIDKLQNMPPRRHLRYGLPFHVEEVTKQARLVYNEEGDTLYVIRCFATHKEYERWYQSYK
jgi:mRNA-degrading endonuclease RelE of RelBE toxin-antitoxin system